jgi:transposase
MKGPAMTTIAHSDVTVTGGVDTHLDTHMAAALDGIGGQLGIRQFPATPDGYIALLAWLASFGTVVLVGVEGTGSYGAGLTRHLQAAGIKVVEVDRPDRQSAGGVARAIRSTRWLLHARRCRATRPRRPRPEPARLRRSGCCASRAARHGMTAPRR